MTPTPAFSVVIPTHNRARLVERAIRSVQAQSFRDFELVVVDDGSSDGTAQMLGSLQVEGLRVVRNPVGRGASAARNCGVAAATAPFVVFLDDDDEFRPGALAALHARLVAFPQVDFLWGARLIHEKDAKGRTIENRHDDWRALPCPISGSDFLPLVLVIATSAAFAIRRSLFHALGGFDESLRVSEDRDLFLKLAEGSYPGAAVPETIIDVYESSNSLSRGAGLKVTPDTDLRVIEKHRAYVERPEHRRFLDDYYLVVFSGFLQAGRRGPALGMLGQLWRRGALDARVLARYRRHAPEFRAIKRILGYNTLRRIRNRRKVALHQRGA
jgi:glycosyltransferase involved in cell wall biosynthesis